MNWRPRTVVSLFGPICLWLTYYRCEKCGKSQKPWDERLGLSERALTPAAAEVVTVAGLLTSFAEASQQTLKKMSGLTICESTVERTTEDTGRRVRELRGRGDTQGPTQDWKWQRDAQGRTCAYVSLDHTGIRQQGPRGKRADGRMVAVAMVYNPRSDHDERRPEPRQVRYLSGFYSLDDIGRQLRREAEAVGVMQAEQQIALSDGGSGLEEVLKAFFPNAVFILDFYHAKEHLVELAQAFHPTDEVARKAWTDMWCHRLKHEGGQAVLKALEELDVTGYSAATQEVHRKQVTYFRNHAHRMDYRTYVANGWQIGSGPVESACKTVIGNRLKGGGMRWGEAGSDEVAHARGAYLSEHACWNTLWTAAT